MADDTTILAKLKVQNRAGFVGDLKAASKSVLGFGLANEEAAAAAKVSKIESFALRQGLYTVRRELFYTSAAVLGGAGALIHLGFAFDSAREEGETAFTALLGSATLARREMQTLTQTSFDTGLGLSTISEAAQTMTSFGFATRAVNEDVKDLGNFAERTGASFTTLVDVFDQIQAQGRLTGVNLRTLTRSGLPALRILQQQLHLTESQTAALQSGKLVIPARYALPALAHGAGQIASQRGPRLEQELGRTHSFLAAIFGAGEGGLFSGASTMLVGLNARLERGVKAMQKGGGVRALLTGIDPSGKLLAGWKILAGGVDAVTGGFKLLWTVTRPVVSVLAWLIGGTSELAQRSGLLAFALRGLGFALKVLTALYILDRARLIAVWVAQKIFREELLISTGVMKAYEIWVLRAEYAQLLATRATGIWTGAMAILDSTLVATEGAAAILLGTLTAVAGIGVIVIGVELVMHAKGINEWIRSHVPGVGDIQDWSDKTIPGVHWLNTHAPNVGVDTSHNTSAVRSAAMTPMRGMTDAQRKVPVQLEGNVIMDGRKVGEVQAHTRQLKLATT